MHKQTCLLILLMYIAYSCNIKATNKITVTSVNAVIDSTGKSIKGHRMYTIEIEFKNETNTPAFFWSWHNRWYEHILSNQNDYYFINFISDAPICIMLLPRLKIKFKSRFYYRNDSWMNQPDSFFCAFLYFDAIKYSEETYLKNHYFKNSNNIPIIADTIHTDSRWYRYSTLINSKHTF